MTVTIFVRLYKIELRDWEWSLEDIYFIEIQKIDKIKPE